MKPVRDDGGTEREAVTVIESHHAASVISRIATACLQQQEPVDVVASSAILSQGPAGLSPLKACGFKCDSTLDAHAQLRTVKLYVSPARLLTGKSVVMAVTWPVFGAL